MGAPPSQTNRMATHLAESLCAKLCHEMSGPLGTVTGALELATEDPDSAAESLLLAQEAAVQMVQRLRLSRAAWAGDCGPLDAAGLAELATGLPPRVHLDCAGLAGRFAPATARVLVNMVLLAVEALPRGGAVHLSGAPESGVALLAAGPHAAWPAYVRPALADPLAAKLDDPREIQAPLAALLALEAGLRLTLPMPMPGIEDDGRMAPLLLANP